MAVKWNKIYRGPVERTTPHTREVNPPATGTLLPGTAVTITTAAGANTIQKGVTAPRNFFYLVGENLHGSVDDDYVTTLPKSSVRLYTPISGDLYAGRAVAGLVVTGDDTPLTIDADGRFAAITADEVVYAYLDNTAAAHPRTEPTTTVLDQLIPIKIK